MTKWWYDFIELRRCGDSVIYVDATEIAAFGEGGGGKAVVYLRGGATILTEEFAEDIRRKLEALDDWKERMEADEKRRKYEDECERELDKDRPKNR